MIGERKIQRDWPRSQNLLTWMIFQRFINWCRGKGITYTTHGASNVDLLVAKSGKFYCEGLALSLVKVE